MADIYAVRIPPMERVALADMAFRLGQKETDLLATIIRDAVRRDLLKCKRATGHAAVQKLEGVTP